jgi:hypothetical protein
VGTRHERETLRTPHFAVATQIEAETIGENTRRLSLERLACIMNRA